MKITKPKFCRSSNTLSALLERQLSCRRFVILTDETVGELCLPLLAEFMQNCAPLDIIEVEAGEGCKSPEVAVHLWSHLLEVGATKSDVIVCIGGGSVTDLGGFIAATYKRGMPCIFVPTTLLAMTDAAIGGKNGLDVSGIKNAAGTIMQPEAILIYPGFCDTLSHKQFLSGMAEVIKHGIIGGSELWHSLQQLAPESHSIPLSVLRLSLKVKQDIVRLDPMESGVRRKLNFGHTVGHAIEATALHTEAPIDHGFAVAMGMLVEIQLAVRMRTLAYEVAAECSGLIRKWFSNDLPSFPSWMDIESFFKHDKKADAKKFRVALPHAIGCVEIVDIDGLAEIESSYNECVIN